jgi:adenine-specific DNA-methyltransferase
MAKKKPSSPKLPTPVDSVKHKDKRANIPTEELRDFIVEDEKAPKTILYPRDPSLDPQLVWKGKDELDAQDLAVPAVPIYIQEHIKPQAIVELVRTEAVKGQPQQPMLFNDFNGMAFQDRVDFYHHEQNWTNRMILGDSLMVMTSLAEKEGLKGKVQMMYIDPPYGIKFGSNWQVSTRKRDVKDGKAEDATRQPEQVKAFRDTWQLGIHSYLSYLRDRLTVARELLTETGSVFVQIGVENVHVVRAILDEVFGSENFVSQILYRRGGFQTDEALPNTFDYILWFAKQRDILKFRRLYTNVDTDDWYSEIARWVKLPDGTSIVYKNGDKSPENGRVYSHRKASSATGGESSGFPVELNGVRYAPPLSRGWSTSQVGMERLKKADRLIRVGNTIRFSPFYDDFPLKYITNGWFDTVRGGFTGGTGDEKIYVVQTATEIVQRCMLMTTDPGDLVLDPTCGSGTAAYVAEQWGRRWITIDTSRVAIALARTRLMAGGYAYYLLADSVEGKRKEAELTLTPFPSPLQGEGSGDIKRGFVYERVPHVTLKSIANNEEIDEIHAKYQERLEALRGEINKLAKNNWEEWEIPREVPKGTIHTLSGTSESPLREYWQNRLERQKEIDASIARHADTEFLYDKPYEDKKRIRVAGPFTVESLSPHRVLTTDDHATSFREDALNTQDFTQMILENLKTAGVQNTIKNQRLKFERLEPYAGVWIHAIGEYTEKDGKTRRAAISIGPELGTVSPEQIKEAAKEAVRGVGFDMLIVCGFAFDPHVSEEAKRYGELTVLPTHMNPDLAMGDELLKKTGAGNLFMVFGEPDLDIKYKDGKLTVHLKGLDVYDPTTGEIRSNSTDDIACWFIDTDYNGESFIVRHAYFTGADEPYEKLKRSLRAEIDESAWSALYSTTSYPFEKPKSGKIAVKVINHYGDEVLKVYEVS